MTRHESLALLLRDRRAALARGPVLVLVAEDGVELASTIRHHLDAGFRAVVLVADRALPLPPEAGDGRVHVAHADLLREGAAARAVTQVCAALPEGTWLGWLFNAEYLFHPFCEHRRVGELCAFVADERRASVLATVVDLYAGDLAAHPSAVSIADAHLDRTGYYALARRDRDGRALERQLDVYGGLRWRHEEHVPPTRRRIDRVGLFRARTGLVLRPDRTLSDPEMNTYACPWHHSPTAAVASFRTAKALRRNPGSARSITTFRWPGSVRFEWHSRQLLDLGLMEPGQWF